MTPRKEARTVPTNTRCVSPGYNSQPPLTLCKVTRRPFRSLGWLTREPSFQRHRVWLLLLFELKTGESYSASSITGNLKTPPYSSLERLSLFWLSHVTFNITCRMIAKLGCEKTRRQMGAQDAMIALSRRGLATQRLYKALKGDAIDNIHKKKRRGGWSIQKSGLITAGIDMQLYGLRALPAVRISEEIHPAFRG